MIDIEQEKLAAIIDGYPTFSEILHYTSGENPNDVFLIEGGNSWTYAEFNRLVDQCCQYYLSLDLKHGDIISVILRNSIDYLILYFASLRSRVIINPFPFHISPNEVLAKVETLSPKTIFCHKSHVKTLSNSPYRVINLDDLNGDSFTEMLAGYGQDSFLSPETSTDATALMYYSSGTTGSPKIIEYTHRSMVICQASLLRSGFIKPKSVHLCFLPLGHTASLRYTIKPCICTGSRVILYESFWKMKAKLWDEVERHGATFMEIVPSILIAILNTPYRTFSHNQAKTMDFIGCGSAYLPQKLQDAFESKFGIPVSNLYGLSETNATHFDNPREAGRKTGNIGRPFDIVDVQIFDEQGGVVQDGSAGEFGIKGPGLLKGYCKDEKPFASYFKDGYFMTGDLGWKDEHGIYYYLDRKKDLIIRGGVNIVPSQIEEALLSHPGVAEAAVIGKPDMLLGEAIKCYIVLKAGSSTDKETLKAHCKERIGAFKTPSEIEFTDELPKGPSGKVQKRLLREKDAGM